MHGLFRVFVCRSRVRFVSNVFSCSPLYLALVAADTNECIVFGGWSAHIFRPEILCEAMPNIDWVCDGVQQSIWASRKHPVLFSVRPCIFIAPFLSEHSSLFTWFVILFSGGAFVCVVYTQILWGVQNPTSALTNSTTIHRAAAAHKLRLACFRAGRLLCIASLLLLLKQWHCLATSLHVDDGDDGMYELSWVFRFVHVSCPLLCACVYDCLLLVNGKCYTCAVCISGHGKAMPWHRMQCVELCSTNWYPLYSVWLPKQRHTRKDNGAARTTAIDKWFIFPSIHFEPNFQSALYCAIRNQILPWKCKNTRMKLRTDSYVSFRKSKDVCKLVDVTIQIRQSKSMA